MEVNFGSKEEMQAFKARLKRVCKLVSPGDGGEVDNVGLLGAMMDVVESTTSSTKSRVALYSAHEHSYKTLCRCVGGAIHKVQQVRASWTCGAQIRQARYQMLLLQVQHCMKYSLLSV